MEQHNKIINSVARKILKPHEIFQKGASRTWLDDNDYYLIIVEFQPSAYLKGSFLNVAVNFLWKKTKGLNEILSYDYGGRMINCRRAFFNNKTAYKKLKKEIFRLNL